MKSSGSDNVLSTHCPGRSGPPGSTVVPATCCPGCARATSRSSTTSTWTARRPRRWWTPGSSPSSTRRAIISGRYPNLGPEILVEAGVVIVDGIGAAGLAGDRRRRARSGSTTAPSYVGDRRGRQWARRSTRSPSRRRWSWPGPGWPPSWRRLTHNSTEFLRREQDLLLHGGACPGWPPRSRAARSSWWRASYDHDAELAGVARVPPRAAPGPDRGRRAADVAAARPGCGRRRRRGRRATEDAARRPPRCAPPATSWSVPTAGSTRGVVEQHRAARDPARCVIETARHARGRRPAARRRGRRRRVIVAVGHARHGRRVPRQPAAGLGQHLPDPAQGRAAAGRRRRRAAPLLRPGPAVAPAAGHARRAWSPWPPPSP